MNVMYLMKDCETARSLAKKLHKQGKPGAIIMLTASEMIFFKTEVEVVHIPTPPSNLPGSFALSEEEHF